jgi:hypothetical protein
MKKCCFAAVCAVLVAAVLGAQEGGGVSFSTDYVVKNYAGVRVENGTTRGAVVDYTDDISFEDENLFGGLDGGGVINKPHELIAATAVLNIKDVAPADALKLYAEIAMEGSANSFLGKTGTTHGQVLERLKAKYHFANTEINSTIGAVVAAVVDAEFNTKYGDFIPTAVYGELKKAGKPDALALITNAVTGFFIDPNKNTYAVLTGIHARYWMNGGLNRQSFGYAGRESFYRVLEALSPVLAERVSGDVSRNATALARIPNDPQYDIFSNPPGTSSGTR